MYMLNTVHTLQKNVIVSCDQLGETFRAAPTLLRRGPAFSEDIHIPTLSTQPRANPTPSDHDPRRHALTHSGPTALERTTLICIRNLICTENSVPFVYPTKIY